jgi:cytochrome c-type biogenesis protein
VAAGVASIGLGLMFAGLLPGPMRTCRLGRLPAAGLAGALVLEATFALSWTRACPRRWPWCWGWPRWKAPPAGVALAVAYSLGKGLPFIGFAAGLTRLLRLATFVRRHGAWVCRLGGFLLIAVGPALVTGAWTGFVNWLRATVGPGQIGIYLTQTAVNQRFVYI